MKKISIFQVFTLILLLGFHNEIFAQESKNEGIVSYSRKSSWSKIIQRLPYLSQEEKDRVKLTWGNEEDNDYKEKMKLYFSPKASLYTYESESGESTDGSWSWRHDDYIVCRDFENEKKHEVHEMLGKTYIVDDSLKNYNWRVLNQIKDVNGYVCMKAVTEDTIKKQQIVAWFSQDIDVSAGPERYFGLPGLIMELDINDGDVVIEATKVEFKNVQKELMIPKSKGKKIKELDYNNLIIKHIKDSIKAQRNPYWSLRY